jgi:predicted metal-binding membrane protein
MASVRRDRIVVTSSLMAVIALSWLYLSRMSLSRNGGGMMAMATPGMAGAPWEQFTAAFLIWTVMMVAMMLPTAVQAIDVFGGFARKRLAVIGSAPPTSVFVLGYVAVWTAYSAVAAAGQVALSHASLLAPTLHSSSVGLSVALLLLAGAYQFTSFKDACLTQCRSPFAFLLANWRDGDWSAFVLGMRHGSYCVGCCWALMGLMFVFGAMNLVWMGALSLFMLGEKMAPASWRLNRGAGAVLILGGIVLATRLLR